MTLARNAMDKLAYWILSAAVAMSGSGNANAIAHAQSPSIVIRVLNASRIEGIAGVVLLVNPGDARQSEALVTDAQGKAITHGLHCEICTVSAFDPRGLFVSRTTEFSSSSTSFSLVMQLRPLIDTVGDPKAVSIELGIYDSKGEPLTWHDVVIRPTMLTLENNRLSIQSTGPNGHVNVELRAGDYTVAALNGDAVSQARFEIVTAKEQCPSGKVTCILASPQAPRHTKAVSLQLSLGITELKSQ